MMIPHLLGLLGHNAWADALHWKAFAAHAGALEDVSIRMRLHHIHLVQHAFLAIVTGNELSRRRLEDFSGMELLKQWAREGDGELIGFAEQCTGQRLEEMITIPWFRQPPLRISVAQALTQAAMHSQYHRGQNATRLRELGGEPPLTDYIAWIWKEKPLPAWD